MTKDWNQYSHLFLQLFADCIPVRGATRSAFYDLTRHEIILFPTDYYLLLTESLGKRIGDLIQSGLNKARVIQFLDFLDANELLMLVDDMSEFPPIQNLWDFPGIVQNAIIDVAAVLHDFAKIFNELSSLGCQHVQIRSFSNLLTLSNCRALLEDAQHKSIVGIELILKWEDSTSEGAYIEFARQYPMVTRLVIHSAPQSKSVAVDSMAVVYGDGNPLGQIRFTSQLIDSETQCGIITQRHLTPPSVGTFFEARSFNGCLNRKISIDSGGNIRNCPSMKASYGNIRSTSLLEAVQAVGFKDSWSICKDHIVICRDCEFRYACSDCRAYLETPDDVFSKPLKCGYDPYKGTWSQWTENPANRTTAKLYGIEPLLPKAQKI